jgi:integrase
VTVDEIKRLIQFCPSEFKSMIQAPIYTGMRYGEVCALVVGDFNGETIHIGRSKGGKPRWIPLTDEGKEFFAGVCAGRSADELMFTHTQGSHKGEAWDQGQQRHWMLAACEFADIKPAISYHILRHAYGSHLAMNNVPMHVIAALLGHANGDLRMVTKHYAHLSDSYISDQLKANLPSFRVDPLSQGE